MKDYYQILEINLLATATEIKQAYRRLAMLYHPDKNPSPEAEQIFKEINEAYDVLSHDESRRWYDYKLQTGRITTTFAETQTTGKPKHRDPAYHRRRPPIRPVNTEPSRREILKAYMPYFFWMNQVGVAMMFIFLMDYALPLKRSDEKIVTLYSIAGNGHINQGMVTSKAHRIVFDSDQIFFEEGENIEVAYTPILQTIMQTTYHGNTYETSSRGIYGPIFIFPLALFVTSILGLVRRADVEYAFSLSIISGVLFIFVIVFILTL